MADETEVISTNANIDWDAWLQNPSNQRQIRYGSCTSHQVETPESILISPHTGYDRAYTGNTGNFTLDFNSPLPSYEASTAQQALVDANNPALISNEFLDSAYGWGWARKEASLEVLAEPERELGPMRHEVAPVQHYSRHADFADNTNYSLSTLLETVSFHARNDHPNQQVTLNGLVNQDNGLYDIFYGARPETLDIFLARYKDQFGRIDLGFIEDEFNHIKSEYGIPANATIANHKWDANDPAEMAMLTTLILKTVYRDNISDELLDSYTALMNDPESLRTTPPPQRFFAQPQILSYKNSINSYTTPDGDTLFSTPWYWADDDLPSGTNKTQLDRDSAIIGDGGDFNYANNRYLSALISEADEQMERLGWTSVFRGDISEEDLEDLSLTQARSQTAHSTYWTPEKENFVREFLAQARTHHTGAAPGLENLVRRLERVLDVNSVAVPRDLITQPRVLNTLREYLNANAPALYYSDKLPAGVEFTDPSFRAAIQSMSHVLDTERERQEFKNAAGGYDYEQVQAIYTALENPETRQAYLDELTTRTIRETQGFINEQYVGPDGPLSTAIPQNGDHTDPEFLRVYPYLSADITAQTAQTVTAYLEKIRQEIENAEQAAQKLLDSSPKDEEGKPAPDGETTAKIQEAQALVADRTQDFQSLSENLHRMQQAGGTSLFLMRAGQNGYVHANGISSPVMDALANLKAAGGLPEGSSLDVFFALFGSLQPSNDTRSATTAVIRDLEYKADSTGILDADVLISNANIFTGALKTQDSAHTLRTALNGLINSRILNAPSVDLEAHPTHIDTPDTVVAMHELSSLVENVRALLIRNRAEYEEYASERTLTALLQREELIMGIIGTIPNPDQALQALQDVDANIPDDLAPYLEIFMKEFSARFGEGANYQEALEYALNPQSGYSPEEQAGIFQLYQGYLNHKATFLIDKDIISPDARIATLTKTVNAGKKLPAALQSLESATPGQMDEAFMGTMTMLNTLLATKGGSLDPELCETLLKEAGEKLSREERRQLLLGPVTQRYAAAFAAVEALSPRDRKLLDTAVEWYEEGFVRNSVPLDGDAADFETMFPSGDVADPLVFASMNDDPETETSHSDPADAPATPETYTPPGDDVIDAAVAEATANQAPPSTADSTTDVASAGPDDAGEAATPPANTKPDPLLNPDLMQRIREFQTAMGYDTIDGRLNDQTQAGIKRLIKRSVDAFLHANDDTITTETGQAFRLNSEGTIFAIAADGSEENIGNITALDLDPSDTPDPENALAYSVLGVILEETQGSMLAGYKADSLEDIEDKQRAILGRFITDERDQQTALNQIHAAKTRHDLVQILRNNNFNSDIAGDDLNSFVISLWNIEQEYDRFNRDPDFSAIADQYTNPAYNNFHRHAGAHDIVGFLLTGRMDNTLDALRATKHQPLAPSTGYSGYDDRFFIPTVYKSLRNTGKVDAGYVDGRSGVMLSRAQLSEIALERFEQAARDSGIADMGQVTQMMMEGKFNPYFRDFELAYEGLVPDGSLTIEQIRNHPALGEKYLEGILEDDGSLPDSMYLGRAYRVFRDEAFNEKFGSMADLDSVQTCVNGKPRDMSMMDIGARYIQRVRVTRFEAAYGIPRNADLSYNEIVAAIRENNPAQAEQLVDAFDAEIKRVLNNGSVYGYYTMISAQESPFDLRQDYEDLRRKEYLPGFEDELKPAVVASRGYTGRDAIHEALNDTKEDVTGQQPPAEVPPAPTPDTDPVKTAAPGAPVGN